MYRIMNPLLETEKLSFSVLPKYSLKHYHFHGGFTEVFIVVGVPRVPRIQYTLSP